MTTWTWVKIDECTAVHETEKALLVECDGDKYWIPKSVIHDDSECFEKRTSGCLIIPAHIADEHGLDGEDYDP